MAEMEEKKTAEETAEAAAGQDQTAGSKNSEQDQEEVVSEENKETDEAESSGEQDAGKKTFFDKLKDKKKDKKDPKDQQIEDLTDRIKRNMAEFDNFRKRTEKEKAAMFEVGARAIIEKILPVVDNFERGLATVPEDKKEDSFVDGMDKVYKQLINSLEEMGVAPIEAVGKEFDPNLHNAVMHVEDENFGENVVAAEFQKGYTYKGTVIRHSMVQVAN